MMMGIKRVLFLTVTAAILLLASGRPNTLPDYCHPGEELRLVNGTWKCAACPSEYYSQHGEKCLPCKICARGQEELSKCSPTINRVCRCPEGRYMNHRIQSCVRCSTCGIGTFQVGKCWHNLDRKCQSCKPGYTTEQVNARYCVPRKEEPPPLRTRPPVTILVTPRKRPSSSKEQQNLILVIIVAACSIALILLCAAFCYWRRKKTTRPPIGSDAHPLCASAPPPALNNNLDPKKGMMLRNVPFSCIESLGEKLNSHRAVNWKNVAAGVGITAEQISIYNLEPKNATQCLLSDWSTRQDSTVNKLYAILLPLRPDAAEILEPYLTYCDNRI